jgi:C terminal of Calcineurin-like phosphoesterase/Calcineurin-like phosphoesterase
MVSNGRDVVLTDSEGRWTLPVVTGDQVFVIKPRGWTTPSRANGLPAIWHSIDNAGEALDEIDFALWPQPEADRFDVLLLADTQPQTPREVGYLRDTILATASRMPAAFAINHGDVVFDDLALYPDYLLSIGQTGMPWHHCPGNHDMDRPETAGGGRFATWASTFGPSHYAFEHGNAVFILLNNVEPLAAGRSTAGGYGYRGAIGDRQLSFVRNVLAHVPHEKLVVLSMHIPLVALEAPDEPANVTHDCMGLLALLADRPHTVSFAGHTHTTEHHYLGLKEGWHGPEAHHHHVLTAASGGWWSGPMAADGLPVSDSRDGTPKGFHVLSVDGNRYTTRFVSAGHEGAPDLRISVEATDVHETMARHPEAETLLGANLARGGSRKRAVVNVFDGGPRTLVRLDVVSVTSEKIPRVKLSTPMRRVQRSDPHIVQSYAANRSALKSWVEAAASSHVWEAALPDDLVPGTYRFVVNVTDEYGRTRAREAFIMLGHEPA